MRRGLEPPTRVSRTLAAVAAVSGCLAVAVLVASPAEAADGWSRTPGAGLPGTTVHVASSPAALCRWLAPEPPPEPAETPTSTTPGAPPPAPAVPGDPVGHDGSRVEIRLSAGGTDLPMGTVPVTPGGAWAGDVSVPVDAAAGSYALLARCIVDDPDLDGARSFDFGVDSFDVVEGPPPTTLIIPTEIGTAITETRVEVQDRDEQRPPSVVANDTTPVRTLPETGDGTNAVALAGVGALAIGGFALWFGARAGRRSPHTS